MRRVNYAAIDIGSNAVRLLIKRVNPDSKDEVLTKQMLVRVPLRLGQDSFTIGEISPRNAKNLLRVIRSFRQLMKVFEVVDYRACATSAMRDARNSKEITWNIFKKTGIQIDVISGQEEARIVYDNHIEKMLNRDKNYIYVDVGGGSTEVILISRGRLKYSKSYNVGTVRMLNKFVRPEDLEMMHHEISNAAALYPELMIIGSGGNINKLYQLVSEKDATTSTFSIDALKSLNEQMKMYSPEERRKVFRLKPDRAEVIVPAADIFLDIAAHCGAERIMVPTIGLADGIIESLFARDFDK